MEDERALPIEASRHGLGGVVRGPVVTTYNQSLPDLIAHRAQAWRFLRLSRIFGAARGIVLCELGEDAATAFSAALIDIGDRKGDFTAGWRSEADLQRFSKAVDRAMRLEREVDILHVVGSIDRDDG
jgi:hypothetical protein